MDSPDRSSPGDRTDSPSLPSITFDEERNQYVTRVDPTVSDNPSYAIVQTIARITENDPIDLKPLGNRVVPEYLDGLFDSLPEDDRELARVTFPYEGHEVTVTAAGDITVSPIE